MAAGSLKFTFFPNLVNPMKEKFSLPIFPVKSQTESHGPVFESGTSFNQSLQPKGQKTLMDQSWVKCRKGNTPMEPSRLQVEQGKRLFPKGTYSSCYQKKQRGKKNQRCTSPQYTFIEQMKERVFIPLFHSSVRRGNNLHISLIQQEFHSSQGY